MFACYFCRAELHADVCFMTWSRRPGQESVVCSVVSWGETWEPLGWLVLTVPDPLLWPWRGLLQGLLLHMDFRSCVELG